MRLFECTSVRKELFAYVLCFRSYVFVKFVNINKTSKNFGHTWQLGCLCINLNNFFTVGPKHTKVVWNVFYTDQASAWNRYEMDISHPRLALGPQSCTPVWQSLKSAFFAWGRLGRMRFSPTCTRPIWMQPRWEERAETRLQLSKSFVATDSLEVSLCTLYAWKLAVRESAEKCVFRLG